ncbi:Sec-independent protein translocase protein TatB [Neptunicella sp.]|uniref:Sec-independent protein translocase protein TatB n=1 Tax=Neptunicella sp. TaxID=2125986 RepID=UPI003F693124
MFDIGFWELLLIGIVALLVLGPERLPGAIRSASKTLRSVKSMAHGFKNEMSEQLRIHELHADLKKAEQMNMKNLTPELERSVKELTDSAKSVQHPYKKVDDGNSTKPS